MERLALLKALGDNTRYAIYLEIARSPSPRSTADIAETLGLHPNTVRPHLERMRDVGLLDVEIDSRGSVGRPQHRYSVASDAPSLGLEPPAFPLLAGLLAGVAAQFRPDSDDVAAVGREQGRAAASRRMSSGTGPWPPAEEDGEVAAAMASARCVGALLQELSDLGFDPASDESGPTTNIAFTHCPYRELAEAFPELICHLHRGIVEGFVSEYVDALAPLSITAFHTLVDRLPCQMAVTSRYAAHEA